MQDLTPNSHSAFIRAGNPPIERLEFGIIKIIAH
jgi:hypothetical protein